MHTFENLFEIYQVYAASRRAAVRLKSHACDRKSRHNRRTQAKVEMGAASSYAQPRLVLSIYLHMSMKDASVPRAEGADVREERVFVCLRFCVSV